MTTSRKSKLPENKLVVAAIDFGTTYSGYSWALRHDFESEPPRILTNTSWVAGGQLMSLKTPSILLLNNRRKFEAFGFEAEDKYSRLAADDEQDKYYYFRRFKMKLYDTKDLRRDTTIKEERGKTMNAITVFSISIQYLKDHFMKNIRNRLPDISDSEIFWVITVPAIWNDGSKQFMREAAEKAGIESSSLLIALEPEAASLFCMHIPVEILSKTDNNLSQSQLSPFTTGARYMVVDAGGGTVDISVHEVVEAGKLKELHSASGGAWGGTRVDFAFEQFLRKIFGSEVFDEFKEECAEDWIELQRQFETKKRSISIESNEKETLSMPVSLVEILKQTTRKKPETVIKENTEFSGLVVWKPGKMRIDHSIFKGFFTESCESTVEHVKNLLAEEQSKGVRTILLVGGFSESPLLHNAFKTHFSDKRIIVPEEPGVAVVKGAVMFGHDPVTIVSRVAKCSYGIRVFRDFIEELHPKKKRQQIGGRMKCKDVFAKHVEKGQELTVGQPQSSQRYTPLEADQVSLIFDIYTSSDKNPNFVTDDGSTYIGQLDVEVPDQGEDRGVWVNMIFGGTEVTVEARHEETNKVSRASFNFLQ